MLAFFAHDDPAQIDFAITGLARAGLETSIFHDGKEIFVSLFEHRNKSPDLVVLRISLSFFTGLEILEQMRLDPQWRNTPVILLADSTEEQQTLEVLDLPLCSCFIKPLTFAKLVYALPRLKLRISDSLLYSRAATPP